MMRTRPQVRVDVCSSLPAASQRQCHTPTASLSLNTTYMPCDAVGGGGAFRGVDLADPRFADLLTSHHFALDPTDPRFK